MIRPRQAASALLAACVLLLCGCVTRGPLLESPTRAVELDATPFFPQARHECGPAALATVLGASRVTVTPEELEQRVYLPGRRGSLQIEMQAAPRAYGRLSYRIAPELPAIVAELDAGRPVLVLHNYGLPFWPRWHYAVVVGYDGAKDHIILRSGKVRRQVLSAANFMRAWDNGGRWALVMLQPGELPAMADRRRYLESAAAFEGIASPQDAWRSFDVAARQWPDDPVALIGRGTASYREGALGRAIEDYRAALRIDGTQVAARNNLAVALLESGCVSQARQEISRIDPASLGERMKAEILDTQRQIDSRAAADESAATCGTAP
ncbi:MAG TPA: PA2778 family cysteine peptidase [Steroidobacteraceae bacterium]|nr:PA2778 family cysteine peptidase [Steroidobacteraceae bacterium]